MVSSTALFKTFTLQILSGERVIKERPLINDINDKLFVETQYVQLSKRKGKTGELPYEDISFDVYQQKKCGFLTKRPLAWATAIGTYLNETSDTEAR